MKMKLLDQLFCYPDTKKNNLTCFQPYSFRKISRKHIMYEEVDISCWIGKRKLIFRYEEVILSYGEKRISVYHDPGLQFEYTTLKIEDNVEERDEIESDSHHKLINKVNTQTVSHSYRPLLKFEHLDAYDWIYFMLKHEGDITIEKLESYLIK